MGAREIVATVVVGLLVLVALPEGVAGVGIVVGLAALVVAAWALIRGRSRTFRIRSRSVGLGVLLTAASVVLGSAGAYGAMHPTSAVVIVAGSADPSAGRTPAATAGRASAAALSTASSTPETPTATVTTSAAPTSSALAVLATLTIKGKSPLTGYDRVADFGPAWLDVDRNGCDTRNDILRRDLTSTTGSGCRVLTGTLHDPYTGKVIHFVRGNTTSTAVQIDHVVALADAWQTGAQKLSLQQRADLGNDPINLFAVDGPTNEAKGDGDTATWLPSNRSFRCEYVAHQIGVKAAYHLWVTPAEHDAMQRVLTTCPSVTIPTSVTARLTPTVPVHTTAPRPPAATKPRSTSGGSSSSSHHASPPSGSKPGSPAGATARCRDGSYSFSAHRRGTCSHHGGVAVWLRDVPS
ncbi:GmrSD restriction endonuclease domain-containing protein [Amnibacterium sp.]|uniref:GmrSD restriction endonuclease domain-containing protein n=1 Tax=Amnibacterium sp. TaxID=1872496 RepID=UPI003F7BF5FF